MRHFLALSVIATIASKAFASKCFSEDLGYVCCSKENNNVVYSDEDGQWGFEDGQWCGIISEDAHEDPYEGFIPLTPQWSTDGNPFKDSNLYVNPEYVEKVNKAIENMTDESLKSKAEKVKEYPTAIWLNNIATVREKMEPVLQYTENSVNETGTPLLPVFVLNNLPGGNCNLLISPNELQPTDDDYERYINEYVEVIRELLTTYDKQPVVLVIEPNSIASIVAYSEVSPACAEAKKYTLDAHKYIIQKLGTLPHVSLYLDIGNTYWLGWDDYIESTAKIVAEVVESGSPGKVRGFASNVGKYAPWEFDGEATDDDGIPDEKRYLEAMYDALTAAGVKNVNFIEDSSRNGKATANKYTYIVCNEKDVSMGMKPQANPIPDNDHIDAFYWISPVGDSIDDGSMGYGEYCLSHSPKLGEWFQKHFELGLANANPAL